MMLWMANGERGNAGGDRSLDRPGFVPNVLCNRSSCKRYHRCCCGRVSNAFTPHDPRSGASLPSDAGIGNINMAIAE
jgi:hypothetical protein